MKNYLKNYLLYALLIVIVPSFIYYFNTTKNKILNQVEFNKKIAYLKILNKDLELLMGSKINQLNYDNVEITLDKFKDILEKTSLNSLYDSPLKQEKILKIFLNIESSFLKKREFIEKYKSYTAVVNNSLRYIPTLYDEINESDNTKINLEISKLYSLILQFSLYKQDVDYELSKSINRVSNISRDIDLSKKIDKILVHFSIIYINHNKLSSLIKKSDELKLDQKIDSFANVMKEYLDERVKNTSRAVKFLVVVIFLLTIFVNLIFYFNRKSEIQLRYFKEGVDKSDNSVILTDINKNIIYVNEAFEKTTGYKKEEIVGKNPRVLRSSRKNELFYKKLHETISEGKRWFGEFENITKDGKVFYEKASIIPIFDKNNELKYYMSIKLDITEQKEQTRLILEKNKEIIKRFYFDSLTSLPNRNKMLKDLKKRGEYTLILVNIDAFKEINDFYGIKTGDLIIKKCANILKNIDKSYSFEVYRLHADEFGVLISKVLSTIETISFIDKIEKSIQSRKIKETKEYIPFNVSSGISYINHLQVNNKMMLVQANIALKHAKKYNKIFAIFNKSIDASNEYENNILWLKKLKEAILKDKIVPYFQPIVDNKNKNVLYYEALIRLIDEDGSIISPFKFLDISKKAKLYSTLTKIMINKTFDIFENRDDRFSINFTYEDMVSESVLKLLQKRLSYCKNPQRFIVEVLESESINNYEVAKSFLDAIKIFGCKIAIDDFGSGYSSFERVFELNADYLKIDGAIIKNIDNSEQLRIIVETIAQFSKSSGMKIVSEFVCRGEIVEVLTKLDLHYMQGYHFSPPISKIDDYKFIDTSVI